MAGKFKKFWVIILIVSLLAVVGGVGNVPALSGSSSVVRLNIADGSILSTYTSAQDRQSFWLCFDGVNVWVSGAGALNIARL